MFVRVPDNTWMRHGTYVIETWHTIECTQLTRVICYCNAMPRRGCPKLYTWFMARMRLSHGTHMNEWVMAHTWMSESWHTHEWVSHVLRRIVCRGCPAIYEWVMAHMWLSHGTLLSEWVMSQCRWLPRVPDNGCLLTLRGGKVMGNPRMVAATHCRTLQYTWNTPATHLQHTCYTMDASATHCNTMDAS